MNIHEIVAQYMRDHGYDGLMNRELGCTCTLDAVLDCSQCTGHCTPGYVVDGRVTDVLPDSWVPDGYRRVQINELQEEDIVYKRLTGKKFSRVWVVDVRRQLIAELCDDRSKAYYGSQALLFTKKRELK